MKKLLFLILFGLFIASCANDFDVTAPWKDIPVVYAILSPQDTAHYIRVEKAFVDPEKSALEVAQIADSLYYPENSITVWLERADNGTRVQLHRVDGNLEGHPRKPGIFATQPNWLYKVKPNGSPVIEGGKTYRLVIERVDGKPDVTAETTIPKDFFITSPDPSQLPTLIAFAGKTPTSIIWRTDANGVFFNVTFKIRYAERLLNGTLLGSHELVWEAAKNIEREANDIGGGIYRASLQLTGNSFYNFLAKNLQRPPADRYRQLETCDIIIEGGGKEIKEYLETLLANSNLTGAETFPNYTNLSEGVGIFTGKNRTVKEGVFFKQPVTVDSMNMSSITDTLGFR